MTKEWDIDDIRQANEDAGGHYFEESTLRFFDSEISDHVSQGPGGIFFITSEQFHGSQGSGPRRWSVRKFDPDTGDIRTAGKFQAYADESEAIEAAEDLAAEGVS